MVDQAAWGRAARLMPSGRLSQTLATLTLGHTGRKHLAHACERLLRRAAQPVRDPVEELVR